MHTSPNPNLQKVRRIREIEDTLRANPDWHRLLELGEYSSLRTASGEGITAIRAAITLLIDQKEDQGKVLGSDEWFSEVQGILVQNIGNSRTHQRSVAARKAVIDDFPWYGWRQ